MNHNWKLTTAAVLTSMLLFTSPLMAAGGGGGSSSEETDSNEMTYITIGLVVLVGGYLVYDAITDSGDNTSATDTAAVDVIDTGIDWDTAFPDDPSHASVAVSVFQGENGLESAMQFISALDEMSGVNIDVYSDPMDFGSGSPVQSAVMAHEFFGTDFLVYREQADSILIYVVASPDSIVWTSTQDIDNSIMVVVTELLQSGTLE